MIPIPPVIRAGEMLCAVLAASRAAADTDPESIPHPVISADGVWAGALWLIVAGLFLAAAVIGPIVRANMPAANTTPPEEDAVSDED